MLFVPVADTCCCYQLPDILTGRNGYQYCLPVLITFNAGSQFIPDSYGLHWYQVLTTW
ncbi:unnamed protein product [Ixodes persulcatus]